MLAHLIGRQARVTCAGRTDAGVHATGQVAHVDVVSDSAPALTVARINRALPADIRLLALGPAPTGFDARFSALWRQYAYRVCDDDIGPHPLIRNQVLRWPRPLDLTAMNRAAEQLRGEHDFAAFCKRRPQASTIRELFDCRWDRDAEGVAVLRVRADAFCHSMVRSLVGALLPVGDGRRDPSWPATVLTTGQRDPAVMVMPPYPLVLEAVGYPSGAGLAARQAVTRHLRGQPPDFEH